MPTIVSETPAHTGAVEHMLDLAFGPGRFAKTAYRLREGVGPLTTLSFVAMEDGVMRGSLRFWPIVIGDRRVPALLLGPLAVDPAHRGRGIAVGLLRHGLEAAKAQGHRIVVLVGDEPYYARVGFSRAAARKLHMPGPVDPARLLALELVEGALQGVGGMIGRARADDPDWAGIIDASVLPAAGEI